MTEKPKKKTNWLMYFIALVLLFIAISLVLNGPKVKKIQYDEFTAQVESGELQVSDIKIVGATIYIRTVDSKIKLETFNKKNTGDYYFVVSTNAGMDKLENFIATYNEGKTEETDIDVSYGVVEESFIEKIWPYLMIGALLFVTFLIIKSVSSANNSSLNFGKSRARNGEKSKVKFSDVAGSVEEKEELKEIVDFLKNPRKYTELGARIPKGVLLVGPPGTGKTLLAKAIAGECNAPFFSISGSDFVEMFVGVGASRVRDLFDQAKKNAPCIVFIDEIDAVGRQRGAGLGGGNDEREQTLNQLLVQMDGFEANEGIIVMAATNRPDVLDPALMRPGRFDRQIYIAMPDVKAREQILKVHARNKKFNDDIELSVIAKLTTGFSGADLENLLNEAAILAGRDNRLKINMNDIQEAVNKVIMGPQKKSRVMTEKDREITAYHEAGHAILQSYLEHCDKVQEISIIPRGMAGGYTLSRPETDDNYATLNKLTDLITSYMGGRVAEEIKFKDVTTGASNDIEQATKIARKMVTEFGMSTSLGFINLGSSSEVFIGRDYQTQVLYSDDTASKIDGEVLKILKASYEKATKLLTEHWEELCKVAELLLKKNVIYREELNMILQGKTVKQVIDSMNRKEARRKKKAEKEKLEKIALEQKRIEELKQRTIEALKREGLYVETNIENKKTEENTLKEVASEVKDEKQNEKDEKKNKND